MYRRSGRAVEAVAPLPGGLEAAQLGELVAVGAERHEAQTEQPDEGVGVGGRGEEAAHRGGDRQHVEHVGPTTTDEFALTHPVQVGGLVRTGRAGLVMSATQVAGVTVLARLTKV